MDEPEQWRWIWLGAAVLFGFGEMATPGAFFLAPFGIGAAVAAILAWADVPLAGEWAAFVGISLASFFALRPLARRLERESESASGVGSRRLIGRTGIVLDQIAPNDPGMVRVDHEEWRAIAVDRSVIAPGDEVLITDIEGTRIIVTPIKEHSE